VSDSGETPTRVRFAVAGILLLATILRFWAIGSGIPHTTGTDEPEILSRSLTIMKTGNLNPQFFDYGGLTIYLHAAVASARFISGAMAGEWTSLDQVWEGDFYLWSRAVTALFGVMTVYVVYRIGRRWNVTVALIAALMTAVYPNLVREAHFALTDTPLTFFVTETLLLTLVAGETGQLRWFLIAGLTTGLAAATKYNGLVAVLMPLSAVLVAPTVRLRWSAALAVCGAAALGFLSTAPYTVLDLKSFLNAFGALASHFSRDMPAGAAMDTHLKHIRIAFGFPSDGEGLRRSVGWIGFLLSLFGAVVLAAQLRSPIRRTAALATLVFPLTYFWLITHQSLIFARYAIPMIPMMCLMLAIAIWTIGHRLSGPGAMIPWPLIPLLTAIVVLPPVTQSVSGDRGLDKVHTEELAARWIQANVPPGKLILIDEPRIRLPPAYPMLTNTRLIYEPLEKYRDQGVAYIVTSSQQTDRIFQDPKAHPGEYADWQKLFAATEMVKVIQPVKDVIPGSTITILKIR
jgi:4-amino-4-deoxy-L-arabinose transferase-like glycosyltransferase